MNAGLDLLHTAQPDVFRGKSRFEGRVIFRRCAECESVIWRTPERFVWSHSVPSRTARLGYQ